MARAKVILVDADVISHFIATDHIYELNEILSPHQLYIVDNVYKEATYHPSDKERKNKVDEWLENSKACRISFPKLNRKIMAEFFKLKRDNKLLGDRHSFNCKEKGTLGHRSMQPVYYGCNKGQ